MNNCRLVWLAKYDAPENVFTPSIVGRPVNHRVNWRLMGTCVGFKTQSKRMSFTNKCGFIINRKDVEKTWFYVVHNKFSQVGA